MVCTNAMCSVSKLPRILERFADAGNRFSRSLCGRDSEWRTNKDYSSNQKNFESLLGGDIRHVSQRTVDSSSITNADQAGRRANEDSILAVQVFDQKKFKKKDQGFLGVINVRVGDVVDFSPGAEDGKSSYPALVQALTCYRNAHTRSEEVQ